jgi:DNA-binding MarR family transcriptional regulator
MLSEDEIKILEVLSQRLLAKPGELGSVLDVDDGIITLIQRLQSMDYIKVVEPIGEKCLVITQKGTRMLREAKNPEKRMGEEQHTFFTS